MNTFIYEATHGVEYSNYEVCFSIKTEKTLNELCKYLHEAATEHVKYCWDNLSSYEEIFYPFENIASEYKKYGVLVSPCMNKSIEKYLTPIEKWEGAHI